MHLDPLKNYFKDIEINTVLDVGTGRGAFLQVLQDIFPQARITGVDPHTESLEEAQSNFPGVIFKQMEAEKMDFDEASFDLASISMALHHLSKINRGLKEMKRVVRPQGYIIVNELIKNNLNPAQEMHKMYHHFISRIDRLTGVCHRETFSKEAILQMLKIAGIPVQFYFEYHDKNHLPEDPSQVALRVEKMKQTLERIRGLKEYEILKPQIETFRDDALKHGFQRATNLLIVGRAR